MLRELLNSGSECRTRGDQRDRQYEHDRQAAAGRGRGGQRAPAVIAVAAAEHGVETQGFAPRARVPADVEVSIGRTDSKRALGFFITNRGGETMEFVLDKDQVAELAAFLSLSLPRLLKPLGRKKDQASLVAMAKLGR